MMGKGSMPSEDPMHFGMIGNNGHPYANKAMKECDLLLMVGARVADRSVNQPDMINSCSCGRCHSLFVIRHVYSPDVMPVLG